MKKQSKCKTKKFKIGRECDTIWYSREKTYCIFGLLTINIDYIECNRLVGTYFVNMYAGYWL